MIRNSWRWTLPILVLTLLLGGFTLTRGQSSKPLSESDLIKRIKDFDEEEILVLVQKKGISFKADAAALDRLKEAGASAKVLAAVRRAAANRPGNAVEYDGVLKLLKDGVSEKDILKQLEDSPTRFVPSAEQVRELRKAGASERLLAALRRDRVAINSDIAEYAVILDCSNSMNDKTPEGPTKMDAAKKAVTELIRKLPNDKLVTFTVYGHKVFGKDKKRGCGAVEVVCSGQRLTPRLKDALAGVINDLKAVGYTPLAKAIRDTGDDLRKRKNLCEFLVITDGMETCDGDPALEAKKLNQALNLPGGVNVILFGGDDKEKAAVKKIADEGGGKYYDAGSIKDLLRGLDDVKERTKVAAKVRAATDQARRAESSAEEAKEAAATAKKSAEEAVTAAAGSAAAKPMADRAQRSARKASAAAVEAWEASGEAKKAADTARGMKSESDAAAQVQIASEAADKAADKAQEARSAAEDTREAAKGVRLALENRKKRPVTPIKVKNNQGRTVAFPGGEISWADRVVSFKPGNPGPRRSKDPKAAIGPPDYQGKDNEEDEKHYVALGHGGVLVLEFTDNVLVDREGPDLAIFEIGPEVEPMNISISEDGEDWIDVGQAKGGRSEIDIGPFVKSGQRFRFVRITDAKAGRSNTSDWPGADIDAVGAINTLPADR